MHARVRRREDQHLLGRSRTISSAAVSSLQISPSRKSALSPPLHMAINLVAPRLKGLVPLGGCHVHSPASCLMCSPDALGYAHIVTHWIAWACVVLSVQRCRHSNATCACATADMCVWLLSSPSGNQCKCLRKKQPLHRPLNTAMMIASKWMSGDGYYSIRTLLQIRFCSHVD